MGTLRHGAADVAVNRGQVEGESHLVEEQLAALARSGGALRRALAALAARLVAGRAYEPLGYARLGDYARERLGLSARMLQELARVDASLAALPGLETALAVGRLPWSKVRLIARCASAENESFFIARAEHMSVRALERELRAVARGALEGGGACDEEGASLDPVEHIALRVPARVAFKWQRMRRHAAQVAGESAPAATVLEWVTAEVLAGLPESLLESDVDESDGVAPVGVAEGESRGAANACARHGDAEPPGGEGSNAVPAFLRSLVEGLEALDPFGLDTRLRRVIRLEQRRDTELAPLLRVVTDCEHEWRCCYQTRDAYARERLGMSARKARALLRLERVGDVCPELRDAYRAGVLSWVQAQLLARLVVGGDAENHDLGAWVAWARTVTVRKLEETVDQALVLREADVLGRLGCPEQLAASTPEERDAAEEAAERQTCALPTALGGGVRLRVTAPVEIAQLFRRVLCSVRLALERESGRLPSEGEGFEVMLDGALQAWEVEDRWLRSRSRRELAIFERDGWRCTVPGCSSRRNLHRHHIRFRSAGGCDGPENQTTLCAFHHLRGVHEGRIRIGGQAPDALWFELGTRSGRAPLARFRSGDRVA